MSRLLTAVLALVLIGVGTLADAAPKASLVMDMRDGRVLHARSADRKLHPASLTKMMTLYVTFDAIRRGKVRLGSKFRVSRKAARQPASKLYLRTGQRVTVRSLIHATAIKSANDAALVLAEGIGGSQARFARMMTNQAKRLGMKNTRFLNPHGLTQRGHYSTARDMAILARHLFHDFPEYYHIFARTKSRAAGKRIWSTNRLLSSYAGADGIKTGYTRAAGYNLVASAHRGKKRIIAVAFGERSSRARNRRVAGLLDLGFAKARNSVRVKRPGFRKTRPSVRRGRILVKAAPVPPMRPGMNVTVADAVAAVLASPAAAATLHRPAPEDRARRRSVKTEAGRRLLAPSSVAPLVAMLPVPRDRRVSIRSARTESKDNLPPRKAEPGAPLKLANGVRVPMPPTRPVKLASR